MLTVMAQSLNKLNVESILFGDLHKQSVKPRNFVPLDPPLLVKTGAGHIVEETGEDVYLQLPKKQIAVLKQLEDRLLDVAVQKKVPWFEKELDNEFMKGRFQSSVSSEQSTLRLRKHKDLQAFDAHSEYTEFEDIAADSHVMAVFELSYISFARAKFGGVFFLKQIKAIAAPAACMVDDDVPDESVDVDDEL